MTLSGYFIGKSGKRYQFDDLAVMIREQAPQTLGSHIRVQLEAIGLLEEFEGGVTPCSLPISFAYAPHVIEKQLVGGGMFHAPGFFRALQNDYRIKGEPRKRAITILSESYRLPRKEAEGLLSGKIEASVDETAGTIAYAIVINQ